MDVAGYDVYFGTDPNVFMNEKVVDYELVNSVAPLDGGEDMDFDTTYYWRVDVYEANDIAGEVFHPGIRLSFTTVSDTPVLNPDLPQCVAVDAGENVVFTVEATNPWTNDDTGMTYAWQKVGEGGVLSATDTLEILNAQIAEEGQYYCTVEITATGETSDSREAALVIKREIGHWPFDGNLDDVIGGNHGSYTGTGEEEYGAGQPDLEGSALEFDASEDNAITVPSTAVISGFWSIVFWEFSQEDIPNDGYMVTSGETDGDESMYMRRWHDAWIGGLNTYAGAVGQGGEGLGYPGPYARGQWRYHVLTNDPIAGTAAWYIDGVKVGEDNFAVFDGFDPLIYIGNRKSGGDAFEGLIDDLWLYSYPLDAVDIAVMYYEITGEEVCIGYPELDFNTDCTVDVEDFLIFVEDWLECGRFPAEYCN